MRCINQNHADFIDLLRKTGSNPKILAAQVSVWMDENNTDNIPSTKDIGLNYTVKTSPELYRKYNLLNKDGGLKTIDEKTANEWIKTNNQNSRYLFKVVKTTPDTYSIVIQDNYSNLSKPQKNTIDKIVKEVNNIEDEGNYTTNEDGDVIIKNEVLGLPGNNIKQGVNELFQENPELFKIGTPEQYSQFQQSLNKPNTNPILQGNQTNIEEIITQLEKEGSLEIDCKGKLKAEKGLATSFTKGSQWEIVRDLKGYPSHAQGGVDIKLGKDGFSFTRGSGQVMAAHGLVLPKIR